MRAAVLHSLHLEVSPESWQDALCQVVSYVADLGNEMYVPGFKVVSLTELLLPWMQQDLEELHPDGCMVPLPQTARPSTPNFCSNLQFHGLKIGMPMFFPLSQIHWNLLHMEPAAAAHLQLWSRGGWEAEPPHSADSTGRLQLT